MDYIVSLAEIIADAVNDPAVPKPLKLMWLGNYVEHVAKWAMMKKSDNVVVFIRNCLAFKEKLEVKYVSLFT